MTGEDVLEGLTAVVSVKLREIQFEGQTKGKLGSVEARGAVDAVFADAFNEFLEENPDDARSIVSKSILALKARKAAKAAKTRCCAKERSRVLGFPANFLTAKVKRQANRRCLL